MSYGSTMIINNFNRLNLYILKKKWRPSSIFIERESVSNSSSYHWADESSDTLGSLHLGPLESLVLTQISLKTILNKWAKGSLFDP